MKVVLVNDQLNAGGAEKVLITIANLLQANGVLVSVVLTLGKSALDEQLDKCIPVHYLNRQGRFDLRAMNLLKQHIGDADIVHVHSRYNLRYVMVAKYLRGIYKPKIVFHEHAPKYLQLDLFTSIILKKVDAYIAVLKSMTEWASTVPKVSAGKIHYLPNIVSAPNGYEAAPGVTEKRMVMTGNFRRIKNHLFALELMKELESSFTLDLYGMVDDEPYYQELVKAITDNKLDDRVKIIKGVSNIYETLHQYHFAIHTAVNETGPLVLLEYLNCGLPFITFKTGDVVNNIENEIPEMVIDTFEIVDWKKRINDTMLDSAKRSELKVKMKEIIKAKFSEAAYSKQLIDIYKTVLN